MNMFKHVVVKIFGNAQILSTSGWLHVVHPCNPTRWLNGLVQRWRRGVLRDHMYISVFSMHILMCIVCIYIYIYTWLHIYIYTCTIVHVFVRIQYNICICASVYVWDWMKWSTGIRHVSALTIIDQTHFCFMMSFLQYEACCGDPFRHLYVLWHHPKISHGL